jgi:sporulation protein YqfD
LITGINFEVLLNRLKRQGVLVVNAKKCGKKQLILTIKSKENQKLFAITKELCYNIKKIKDGGRFYPLMYLAKNVGVLVGILVFSLSVILSSDRIYSYSFVGSGVAYKVEAQQVLKDEGITLYSKFSDVDLKELSNKIRQKSDKFSFVSCEKHGNKLKIQLILAKGSPTTIDGTKDAMYSTFSGRIESIRLYRGTAVAKVGDVVKVGDTLISGYYSNGEKVVKVGVIAVVNILTEEVKTYHLDREGLEYAVKIFVEEESTGEVVDTLVSAEQTNDGYLYTAKTIVRRILKSG